MTKTMSLLFSLLSLFVLRVQAHTLVISDIDDTIKIAHVLDDEKYLNGVNTTQPFTGMAELYDALLETQPDLQFAYVSNAPYYPMQASHWTFLVWNGFPVGDLYLRDSLFAENHKRATILKLIAREKPGRVLMIGDNGEKDPEIYQAVREHFPMTPMSIYIHQVYSVKSKAQKGTALLTGQTGFVTSVDLAAHLKKEGLVTEEAFQEFVQAVAPRVLKAEDPSDIGEEAFPWWLSCQDYKESFGTENMSLLLQVQKKLEKRCAPTR